MELKVMSFNVGIWTRNRKTSDPFYWKTRMHAMNEMIITEDPDVICFQELWFPATIFVPKNYKKVFGTGLEHPIYVKKGIKTSIGLFCIHWSMARIEGIRIFSIHGHWDRKKTERLCNSVRKIYAKDLTPAILAGDWNVEYEYLYKDTQLLTSARVQRGLERKETYVHFHDSWRRGEIDHILLYRLIPSDYKIVYSGSIISDHYPITATIKK